MGDAFEQAAQRAEREAVEREARERRELWAEREQERAAELRLHEIQLGRAARSFQGLRVALSAPHMGHSTTSNTRCMAGIGSACACGAAHREAANI